MPALGLAYVVLASWLNRTTVLVADAGLVVTVGPLPWVSSAPDLSRGEVSQLLVVENERLFKSRGGGARYGYALVADTPKGQVALLSGWNEPDLLRGVEAAAEDRLGLLDPARPGEHRGPGRGERLL